MPLDRSDAHASVATVVEHILQESGPSPTDPPRPVVAAVLPPPQPPSPAPTAVRLRRSMGSTNGSVQAQYQPQQQTGAIRRVRTAPDA